MKNTELHQQLNKCINLTVELWNTFYDIENSCKHPSDVDEMARDIHDIQNRIISVANKNDLFIKVK
jgi:hypothetical protein